MDGMPSGTGRRRDLGDEELVALVRSGDQEAFALLYSRHVQTVLRLARRCSRRDAEDLCAEAFASTLWAIKNGDGPHGPIRPYLSAIVRHAAAAWSRREFVMIPVGELADLPDTATAADPVLRDVDRVLVLQAFNSLPGRWRDVLWHTVIDARSPGAAADTFQLDRSAVCSLAYRAREGLRLAYLQAHVTRVSSKACQPFAERLAAFARGRLGPRYDAAERVHLAVCGDCSRALETLREIDRALTSRSREWHSLPARSTRGRITR